MGLNCDDEKMAVISSTSTTNEWPQNNNNGTPMISDDHHQKALNTNHHHNMASSTTEAPPIIMDKQGQDQQLQQQQQQQQQQHQQALKCPRCDSSNTKFCYYNNYSLSQPRHFCKACKRYWTRGGTLRNVPVGGGCRKNKRIRRPSSASNSSAASVVVDANMPNSSSPNSSSSSLSAVINSHPCTTANNSLQGPIALSSPGITSLIYNSHDHVSLPFSRFSTVPSASGYDHLALQPQLSALGLGFAGGETNSTAHDTNYLNGLFSSNNSLLSSYGSIFSTTTSSSMASPTIASLLASKFANGGTLKDQASGGSARVSLSHFQALAPFDELHIHGIRSGHEAVGMSFSMNNNNNNNNNKQVVKSEDGQAAGTRALDWINGGGGASGCTDPNQTDQIGLLSSDPSLYWTNPTAVGGANWHDPANIGSNSVPSMI